LLTKGEIEKLWKPLLFDKITKWEKWDKSWIKE